MIGRLICFMAVTIFCGCRREEQPRFTVDAMDERPVVIAKDGGMTFDGAPLSVDGLAKMVEERVEKDRTSKVPSQYATILLAPDPETPDGKVEAIQDLIREYGGYPGRRLKGKDAQPATAPYSEPAARSPQG